MTLATQNLPVPFTALAEIEHFIAAFENATLPRAEWTHRAHLTMAAWYLARQPVATATPLIRHGILKLNAALGIVSDADHGYHETLTQFYIGLIAHHLHRDGPGASLLDAVNSLLATRGHKELPLEYYSRDRLMSREARAKWVEPDLKPFEWVVNDARRGA